MQITTLLVPHDGSWMADRALACATMLQGATGARLDMVRIAPDLMPGVLSPSAATSGVDTIRNRASAIDDDTHLVDRVAIILDAIERRCPDLVVMASDGWSLIGRGVDAARQVARRSHVPVLVIPTGLDSFRDGHDVRRILVALDGSDHAEQALAPARALADALGADLLLLRVVAPKGVLVGGRVLEEDIGLAGARRYVEGLADALRSSGRMVSALAVVGEPGTMIAAVSRAQRADVLAMTTRGKGAIGRSDLGGIASSTLQSAGLPLLLVPPSAPNNRDDRAPSAISKASARLRAPRM